MSSQSAKRLLKNMHPHEFELGIFYSYLTEFTEESASRIRPKRLLRGFHDANIRVIELIGTPWKRLTAFRKLFNNTRSSPKISFAYVEGSTLPGSLANGWKNMPLALITDLAFFLLCKIQKIKIGFFYRDVHWRFHYLYSDTSKLNFRLPFYWLELIILFLFVDRVFIPSMAMAKQLPKFIHKKLAPLPPACLPFNDARYQQSSSKPIHMIYAGGLKGHYRISKLFEGIAQSPLDFSLTVVSRPDELKDLSAKYKSSKLRFASAKGEETRLMLESADIGAIFVEPSPYWEFAVPLKLYDYVAVGLPILCSSGTETARIVEANKLGWIVDYDEFKLSQWLEMISSNSTELKAFENSLKKFALENQWAHRAKTIRENLVEEGASSRSA